MRKDKENEIICPFFEDQKIVSIVVKKKKESFGQTDICRGKKKNKIQPIT